MSSGKRDLLLVFAAHAAFSTFFCYETLGALGPQLIERLSFSTSQMGFLFAAYSMPAFFSLPVTSVLGDKIGLSRYACYLTFLTTIGNLVIAFSLYVAMANPFPIMVVGQLLFGLGANSTYTTMCSLISSWFGDSAESKRRISIIYGIVHAWLRFGSFASLAFLPMMGKKWGLQITLLASALVAVTSLMSSIIFDLVTNKKGSRSYSNIKEEEPNGVEIKKCDKEENLSNGADSESKSLLNKEEKSDSGDNTIKYKVVSYFKIYRSFPVQYWILTAIISLFISNLYTFTAFATVYFNEEWGLSPTLSGQIASLVCLSNLLSTSLFGWISSKIGKKAYSIILGSGCLMTVHILFQFTKIQPLILVCALGLIQSILDTTLMPTLSLIVPHSTITQAYSLTSLASNTGLWLLPIIIGELKDRTGGWSAPNYLYISASFTAFALSIIFKILEKKVALN
eukprot:TRINITY_DN1332_c1_g1_i6.p1 TRINITY_DN1332_c1_g1~~TRINITY_DN1332_c1_g1_i6.p1  ORF type:complete len:454 (+),score=52.64 TRINITY_DN1332_c1_g1_i6:65-1426(+)